MEKFVLITGASSGLGKETAKKLANEGYKVFAGVRKQEDFDSLNSISENISPVFLDVTNEESVKAAFDTIKEKTQSLSAIINNAGIAVAGPVEYIPIDLLKQQFEVNVYGALRTAQTFIPLMREVKDARIVNISSMASYGVFPFISPYSVSKRALDMYFNSMLIEAKMPNLKIISIKPGCVKTPIWNKSLDACDKNLEHLCEEGKKKYEKEFEFLMKNARKNNEKGLETQDIANLVSKVLKEKNPKMSYNIGKDSHFARFLSYIPQRFLNFLIKKGLENRIN